MTVSSEFQKHLEQLRQDAETIADAADGSQRTWQLPPGFTGKVTPPDTLTQFFDRNSLNSDYGRALAQDGTMADCMGLKIQIGYLSWIERAFRARHMTPCRALALAAGRRRGHGEDGGVFTGSVLPYVQDVFRAGSDEPGS